MNKQEKDLQLPAKRDSREVKQPLKATPRPHLNSGRYHQM